MEKEEKEAVSIGMILLAIASVLVLFGVGQRVLDKMHLTDRGALIIMALIFFGGLVPDLVIGRVAVNIGGALVPLGVCIYLLIRADTGREVVRTLVGSLISAGAIVLLSRLMPDEPEKIVIDPNYVYGLVGGAVAYVLSRSRRGAFVCGVLGVLLADVFVAVVNWSRDIQQMLHLGSAGAMDVVVISGLLAVLLAELVGEVTERLTRPHHPNTDPVETPVQRGKRK